MRDGHLRRPSQIEPSLDKALDAICLKAMAKEPEERYATPKALADDLDRWTADEPVTAWREPFTRRARRWARRKRTAVTAVSVAPMAGVVGLSAVLVVQTRAKADIARSLASETRANTALATANTELTRSHAAVQARYDLAVEAIKTFHTGVSEDFLLKEEPFKELRDRLLKSASDFYGKLGALLGKETDPAARRALAQANFEVAELTRKVGRPEDALAAHRQVLAAREALAAESQANLDIQAEVGRSLTAIAVLFRSSGKSKESEEMYRKAETLLVELTPTIAGAVAVRAALADCRWQLGSLLIPAGRYDEVLSFLRLALADLKTLAAAPGATTELRRSLAVTHGMLGMLLRNTGKFAESEAEYREAMSRFQKLADDNATLTGSQRDLALCHDNFAALLDGMERRSEELAEFRKARGLYQKLADGHPAVTQFRYDLAGTRFNLGIILGDLFEWSEAEAEIREAQPLLQKLVDDNPAVINHRRRLAASYTSLGNLLEEDGKTGGGGARAPQGAGDPAKGGRRQPQRHPDQDKSGGEPLQPRRCAVLEGRRDRGAGGLRESGGHLPEDGRRRPRKVGARSDLALVHFGIGEELRQSGRNAEALDSYGRAIAIGERLMEDDPKNGKYRDEQAAYLVGRGQARRGLGDIAGAAAEIRRALLIFDGLPTPTGEDWFSTALCHAALAGLAGRDGSGVSADLGRAEADQATALLKKAVGMGYREASAFLTKSALDPLRNRPDFWMLMMDLAFPTHPFARGE